MKIVLANLVSILIREEDFTEATLGQEEVTYLRPNGTRVTINFPQAVLATKNKNENIEAKSAKEEQRIAAAELQRQKRREIWAKEQAIKDEEFRQALKNNYKELETKMHHLSSDFKNEIAKYGAERQEQIEMLHEEIRDLWEECDEQRVWNTNQVNEIYNSIDHTDRNMVSCLKQMGYEVRNGKERHLEKHIQGKKNENRYEKTFKDKQRIADAELQRKIMAKEQAIKDEETRQALEDNYKDLETNIYKMNFNLEEELEKKITGSQEQTKKPYEERRALEKKKDGAEWEQMGRKYKKWKYGKNGNSARESF